MVWTQVWNIIDVDGHILHHSWQNERKNNAEKSSTSLKAFVIACELIVHLFRNCFLFLIHSFICVQNCIFSSLHRITYKKPVTVEQNTLRNPSRISCLVFLPFHHPVFPPLLMVIEDDGELCMLSSQVLLLLFHPPWDDIEGSETTIRSMLDLIPIYNNISFQVARSREQKI